MEIKLPRFTIRPFRDTDIFTLARHANNKNVWRFMKDAFPHPYTPVDAERWIARANAATPVTHYAIEVDGEAAGAIGFYLMEGERAEMGYWLGEPFWGRGIATDAVREVVSHIFKNRLARIIYARVFEFNPASAKALFKAGFSVAGWQAGVKNGADVTEVIYRLERRPGGWTTP